jgi:hypothetical protein
VMNYDGAKGWLVGEPHKGLAAMFTMMNDERLAVGIQSLGVSELAYQQAAAYAKDRLQGRNPSGVMQLDKVADNLLAHADVRRMLLTIRARNEAARAFLTYVAQCLDLERFSENDQEQERAADRVALLTPITKAFISDTSFENTVLAQQVLGGHGYIREWGVEQLVRDARITQIYEGTNGVQAMDLLGRKTIATEGKLLAGFFQEIDQYCQTLSHEAVEPYKKALLSLLPKVTELTNHLLYKSRQDHHAIGAAANNFLHLLGYVAYLYMWTKMVAVAVNKEGGFYRVKCATGRVFLEYLLPQTDSLIKAIYAGSDSLMAFEVSDF